MNTIRLNTVLIPEEKAQGMILGLADQIFGGREKHFRVDDKIYFSHLTLYPAEYPTDNLDMVIAEVEKLGKTLKILTLSFKGFHTGWGYLGLEFVKDEPIDKLHKLVLERLNPLREGRIRDKYGNEIKEGKYPLNEVGYINRYGYHSVLDSYQPHLTLGRFLSEELAVRTISGLTNGRVSSQVSFSHVAVSEMGPNGTCTKILARFDL